MGTWRKAYDSLKDFTRVGLAKVNSEFKELDIAIVKATNHVECPPKEKRVRRIFTATSAVRPRADIAYCIFALAKRLSKTHNWVVAIKTLIVIHRLLREGDPTFKEELLNYSQNGILQISNFKDDSSSLAWECSTFARAYALFLEEKLQCFRVLQYDIEAEHLLKNASGDLKGRSKTRTLCCSDLLEQMPPLQQLLHRLSGCRPDGAAFGNLLIQHALILVLKESFKIYCAINDGIINLVEMFFEMRKYDAMKALEIYKRASQQAESVTDFYDFCKHLYLARKFLFPTLKQLPSSFISTMEEYILEEAPYTRSFTNKNLVHQEENLLTYKNNEHINAKENVELSTEEKEERALAKFTESLQTIPKVKPPLETTPDLLSIEDMRSIAEEIEQKNVLSLAVIEPAWDDSRTTSTDLLSGGLGWELALVTTPSNNASNVVEGKLAGGFDKLLLDSLYEDASSKGQQIVGGSSNANSFESGYPLVVPGGIGFSSNIQMNLMAQHQQQQYYFHHGQYQQHEQLQLYHQQQQTMMLQPYGYQTQNNLLQFGQTNPFSLPSNERWQNDPPQGNSSLI